MLAYAILAIENESDREFMEDLYRRHYSLMYRKALSMMKNSSDAEDVVEAAILKLIDRIELLRACKPLSLRSYLLSCVKNAAIDRLRRDSSQFKRLYTFDDAPDKLNAVPDATEVDSGLLHAAQVDAVATALARLPDRERELLRMKYYEELSDREIAAILGLSPSSIRTYMMRARKKLGAILKEAEAI